MIGVIEVCTKVPGRSRWSQATWSGNERVVKLPYKHSRLNPYLCVALILGQFLCAGGSIKCRWSKLLKVLRGSNCGCEAVAKSIWTSRFAVQGTSPARGGDAVRGGWQGQSSETRSSVHSRTCGHQLQLWLPAQNLPKVKQHASRQYMVDLWKKERTEKWEGNIGDFSGTERIGIGVDMIKMINIYKHKIITDK